MSALTSVPTALYHDKKLKDFDIRLYLIIAECVNEYGYTKITNETLCYKTGKGLTAIKDSLRNLVEQNWLKTKFDVKKNNIYDQAVKRVIWLEEFYRKYNYRTRQAKKKTKENDFRLFVSWLKSDMKNIPFPVELGGIIQKYVIKPMNGKDLLHVMREDGIVPIDSFDSNDVYKKIFRKRNIVIAFAEKEGMTKAHENVTKAENESNQEE